MAILYQVIVPAHRRLDWFIRFSPEKAANLAAFQRRYSCLPYCFVLTWSRGRVVENYSKENIVFCQNQILLYLASVDHNSLMWESQNISVFLLHFKYALLWLCIDYSCWTFFTNLSFWFLGQIISVHLIVYIFILFFKLPNEYFNPILQWNQLKIFKIKLLIF